MQYLQHPFWCGVWMADLWKDSEDAMHVLGVRVRISALALLKMAMHAKSGGSIEVMGMLQVRRRCLDDDKRFIVLSGPELWAKHA
jgi:hypothetical protein